MTAYRPIVIIDNSHDKRIVRVEICRETGSRSLSPFIRKVDIDDLWSNRIYGADNLCILVEQFCNSSQPFVIDASLVDNNVIGQILSSYQYLYTTFNRSLKRVTNFSFPAVHIQLIKGRLICGELYIENLSNWKGSISARFRYEDARNSFHVEYTDIPYATVDNRLLCRDAAAEESLLRNLGECYDGGSKLSSISTIGSLKEISDRGWNIFLSKSICKDKKNKRVYFHSSIHGIEWMSTDIESNGVDFLDAYLNGRNYVELRKGVALLDNDINSKIIRDKVEVFVHGASDSLTQKIKGARIGIEQEERKSILETIARNFVGQLKDYQTEGVLWLHAMKKNNLGCLLADEMGLGKTIQVLAYLASSVNSGLKTLIVCPASLRYNWISEIEKFTPQLSASIDVVTFDSLVNKLDDYSGSIYDNVIVDEGQFVKNPNTKRFGAIKKLSSKQTIILTGTPIENSIEDVWTYFSILIPELSYIHKELKEKSTDLSRYVEVSGMVLHPFILRRTKNDVLNDLPQKIEKTIYVDLSDSERNLYNKVRNTFVRALKSGVGGRINSIALEALLRLRQACVASFLLPHSLNPNNEQLSSKISLAIEYIKGFISEHHKTILFTQFTSIIPTIERILYDENIGYVSLTGSTVDRKTPVERFQTLSNIGVFIISLKAGGTGLNLTAADRIILLDDWWNPAVEEQAMGRAHRIGQKNPVLVMRFVCKDTIEEEILKLQKAKKQCADNFNEIKESLSTNEIVSMICHQEL